MKRNIYQPIEAEILDIIQETPSIKTFTLKPKNDFSFRAGQFIELTVPGQGEAPFTPSSDASSTQRLDLTVMNAGRVTSRLHTMNKGQSLGIRGPYGKGYPLDEFKGRDILIVGGGVGLAPLRALLFSLFAGIDNYNKIVLCYGARTPADILYKDSLGQWAGKEKVSIITSVDAGGPGWQGNVGLVTAILKGLPIDVKTGVAIVCGPPIMMKFTTLKFLDLGFRPGDIYLSMEKNMSCGLGKCGHCRIGRYYVCKDGPVFTYEQLKDIYDIWD